MNNDSVLHTVQQMIAKLTTAEELAVVSEAVHDRREAIGRQMRVAMRVGMAVSLCIRGVDYQAEVVKINPKRVFVKLSDGRKFSCPPTMLRIEQKPELKPATPRPATCRPDAVVWKDEGDAGPLWVRRDGKMKNYEDGDVVFNGSPRPVWFARHEARKIAAMLKLPFEEV